MLKFKRISSFFNAFLVITNSSFKIGEILCPSLLIRLNLISSTNFNCNSGFKKLKIRYLFILNEGTHGTE